MALQDIEPVFIAYTCAGFLIWLTNMAVFCSVVRYRQMRTKKEYITVASLALADAWNGFGTSLCAMMGMFRTENEF